MPNFSYKAVDNKTGKVIKGSMDVGELQEVYDKLKADGKTVIEAKQESALTKDIDLKFLKKKVKPRDLSIFCRQFVSIITAGVTIIDAMEMLEEQTENKRMKAAILLTRQGIQKGETLSDSMRQSPDIFPSMLITMVEAGEASGSLDVAFTRMATQFEKDAKLSSMIKKAMIYPIVVGVVAVGVVIAMLTYVVPNYVSMFDDMEMELPLLTRMVMGASNFVTSRWYILIAVVAALVFGFKAFKKTEQGQEILGKIAMKLPVFGNLTVKTACSRFARTLSTLLFAGLPMMGALEIAGNTMTNIWFHRAVTNAKDEVSKGVALSVPLKEAGVFPPMVYHMTGIGEETGDIENMLERMANYYDEEVELATQAVMAALEPMIIIVLAAIVGVLIGAVMSPMLAMYQGMDSL